MPIKPHSLRKFDAWIVRELLKTNETIRALRYIRTETGCGLDTAKMCLQDIKSRRRWTFPKK